MISVGPKVGKTIALLHSVTGTYLHVGNIWFFILAHPSISQTHYSVMCSVIEIECVSTGVVAGLPATPWGTTQTIA